MGDSDDNGMLFNNIIGDMKTMSPLWDDFLIKASKFYGAVKQTAITADTFLDSFQKIADATTNSKGATRDIGVSFTKIVMRHRAIEHKLKTYVGILADSFVTPLQECVDDWRKNCSQLEKDHAKDYKRLKGDLKKASSDVAKLKKKASKKIGKQEYTDHFRDAMKVANHLCKSLEEQEKGYLRKIMIEERSRTAQFFKCYKPCIEQEMTLISEIEQLQSIVEETTKQCMNPTQLPIISEDAINGYKVPENLTIGSRDSSAGSSPPSSPIIVRDRSLTISYSSQKPPPSRSQTLPNYSKGSLDPIAVSVPTPTWSHSGTGSMSSRSSYSSSGSLEHGTPNPIYNAVTLQELNASSQHEITQQNGRYPSDEYVQNRHNDLDNIHKVYKTRTSWSSTETSDSSGIGSYNSLSSQNKSAPSMADHYISDTDIVAPDFINHVMYPLPPPALSTPIGFGTATYSSMDSKYATIDRSHFRNQLKMSSLREWNTIKPRSSSLDEDQEFPRFPDYKMNLPKSRMNTICGRSRVVQPGVRPVVFNIFENQHPSELLKRLSPTASPVKKTPPLAPAPRRHNSSPVSGPQVAQKPNPALYKNHLSTKKEWKEPVLNTTDDEPEPATAGSFEAALQKSRNLMRQQSCSVDHSMLCR